MMEPMQSLQEWCIRLTDGHLPAHEEQGERIVTALDRLADLMAHPLQAVQCSTETTTTPMRVRNEAAVCGNCPYSVTFGSAKVLCRFEHPSAEHGFPVREDTEVCGDHPDFWRE